MVKYFKTTKRTTVFKYSFPAGVATENCLKLVIKMHVLLRFSLTLLAGLFCPISCNSERMSTFEAKTLEQIHGGTSTNSEFAKIPQTEKDISEINIFSQN